MHFDRIKHRQKKYRKVQIISETKDEDETTMFTSTSQRENYD